MLGGRVLCVRAVFVPGTLHDRVDLIAHDLDAEAVRVLEAQLLIKVGREPILSVDVLLQAPLVEAAHVRLIDSDLFEVLIA